MQAALWCVLRLLGCGATMELVLRRLGVVSLFVLGGLCAVVGSAPRAPADAGVGAAGWQPPTTLFSAGLADSGVFVAGPEVAFDGHRRATAVWLYGSTEPKAQVLMEADWTETGGWTPVRTLSSFETDVSGPELAVDARGDAVIAWRTTPQGQVRAAYRIAGEEWQPPRTLSVPGESASSLQVAIDDHGRSLVMWNGVRRSSSGYQSSLKITARGRTGVWGKPKNVCDCSASSALAMNARGLALVVWSPSRGGLWAKTRTPAGRWSSSKRISKFGSASSYMSLALNSGGGAVIGWITNEPTRTPGLQLAVAIRKADGRFGRPQKIGSDAYWGFVVAIARTGEATVMWGDDSCCLFSMSRRSDASSFESKQVLWRGIWQTVPGALAMDSRGNTLALWTKLLAANGRLYIHAAQRPAGAMFDSGSDIGDIGQDSYKHSACSGQPSLTLTPDGRSALALWLARDHWAPNCTAVKAATLTR